MVRVGETALFLSIKFLRKSSNISILARLDPRGVN